MALAPAIVAAAASIAYEQKRCSVPTSSGADTIVELMDKTTGRQVALQYKAQSA
jgi:hypothetical protein